jgi:hypothetical protein
MHALFKFRRFAPGFAYHHLAQKSTGLLPGACFKIFKFTVDTGAIKNRRLLEMRPAQAPKTLPAIPLTNEDQN